MRFFPKPSSILSEITRMRQAETQRREDRAIVSEFFNGAAPLTDAEAEELGFTINVNHLFGYTDVDDAAGQLFSLFTKPNSLLRVELDCAPPGKRSEWGSAATSEASRVIRKAEGFKTAYQGGCGDATLHGECSFFFPNPTFPLPRHAPLSRMLIPDGASTDRTELRSFGVEHFLDIATITKHFKGESKGWKKEALGLLLKSFYEKEILAMGEPSPMNLEEMEYQRQENSTAAPSNWKRPGVMVDYFYQQRVDKPGMPYDLTILLRDKSSTSGDKKDDQVIFERECYISGIQELLCPMFMDTIIGGESKWHRVMGLGTLNYQLNHAVELMVNRAQQAVFEGSMNLWEVTDAATREHAQAIVMKHNGVIPEGMRLAPNRFEPNFSGLMEMIQFYRQAGSKNVKGVTPNNGAKNDQLEVQAIQEMNQGASSSNNRTANWYDYGDRMWTEIFRRFTNPLIQPHDPGYSEVMDFQAAMQRRRIPLKYLQPANVQVTAVRLVGDGLRSKELGIAQFLTQNRNMYAPEVQPQVSRLITGLTLDNYRLAEELTPIEPGDEDKSQQVIADDENAVMLQMRKPAQPQPTDVDEIHVMAHFPAMELLIRDGVQYQKAAFTPQQAEAFQAVGTHIAIHIQRIEAKAVNQGNDPNREKATVMMEQLNGIAQMGEKLLNNMQQAQQGQESQMDPEAMAKLQLQFEQLQLQRQKLEHSVEKFQRTQGFRESSRAFDEAIKMSAEHRNDMEARRNGAAQDVTLGLQLAQHRREGAQLTAEAAGGGGQ